MRIIDLLNLKANRELKNGFKFVYDNYVFIFNKNEDEIELIRVEGEE